MLVWLLACTIGAAPALAGDEVTRLAPTPVDLREELAEAERLLLVADALEEAVSRLQNAWVGDGLATDSPRCDDPTAVSYAVRTELFGEAWRDAAQLADQAARRLDELPAAPTLAPLLTEDDRRRIERVETRAAHHQRAYLEAATWHGRSVAPFAARCRPTLAPVAGVVRSEHRAAAEFPPATAVAVSAPGRICTPDSEIDAVGVVIVGGRSACYSETTCRCTPEEVAPAAVLGPPTSSGDGG